MYSMETSNRMAGFPINSPLIYTEFLLWHPRNIQPVFRECGLYVPRCGRQLAWAVILTDRASLWDQAFSWEEMDHRQINMQSIRVISPVKKNQGERESWRQERAAWAVVMSTALWGRWQVSRNPWHAATWRPRRWHSRCRQLQGQGREPTWRVPETVRLPSGQEQSEQRKECYRDTAKQIWGWSEWLVRKGAAGQKET